MSQDIFENRNPIDFSMNTFSTKSKYLQNLFLVPLPSIAVIFIAAISLGLAKRIPSLYTTSSSQG